MLLTLAAWCKTKLKQLTVFSRALRTTEVVIVTKCVSMLYRDVVIHTDPMNARHKCNVFN